MWFYYAANFAARLVPQMSATDPANLASNKGRLIKGKVKLPPEHEGKSLDELTAIYLLPAEAPAGPENEDG